MPFDEDELHAGPRPWNVPGYAERIDRDGDHGWQWPATRSDFQERAAWWVEDVPGKPAWSCSEAAPMLILLPKPFCADYAVSAQRAHPRNPRAVDPTYPEPPRPPPEGTIPSWVKERCMCGFFAPRQPAAGSGWVPRRCMCAFFGWWRRDPCTPACAQIHVNCNP